MSFEGECSRGTTKPPITNLASCGGFVILQVGCCLVLVLIAINKGEEVARLLNFSINLNEIISGANIIVSVGICHAGLDNFPNGAGVRCGFSYERVVVVSGIIEKCIPLLCGGGIRGKSFHLSDDGLRKGEAVRGHDVISLCLCGAVPP
jgi:hypothetical protein